MDEANPYVTCPYNAAHMIKRIRIQYHLIKCRKVNQHLNLKICPFNAIHHYPEELEEQHLSNCPDKIRLTNSLMIGEGPIGNVSIPPPNDKMECKEDWGE